MNRVRLINATCPDCRGPLSEHEENGVREYRCLVEHRYSDLALLHAHAEAQERALWAAVLALEEAAIIAREIAANVPSLRDALLHHATIKEGEAATLRAATEGLARFTTAD